MVDYEIKVEENKKEMRNILNNVNLYINDYLNCYDIF